MTRAPMCETGSMGCPGFALDRLVRASDRACRQHRDALSWLPALPVDATLVWLPRNVLDRATLDECALRIGLRRMVPGLSEIQSTAYLLHTDLGAPRVVWRDVPAATSLPATEVHISFSHDGDAHIALLATGPGLVGAGVDVVHLPRMRAFRKSDGYLRALSRHFMSPAELERYLAAGAGDSQDQLAVRTAAHFSIMESASKALGTGLRIGCGMGKPESLRKQSISVMDLRPVRLELGADAVERCHRIGAQDLAGHWACSDEYLLSACLLMAPDSRAHPSGLGQAAETTSRPFS